MPFIPHPLFIVITVYIIHGNRAGADKGARKTSAGPGAGACVMLMIELPPHITGGAACLDCADAWGYARGRGEAAGAASLPGR